MMPKYPSLIIAAAAVVAVGIFVAIGKPRGYKQDLKCYFQDAEGLRAGAKVRMAGVEVGSVTSVRVRPELRDHPAEVTMSIYTPYELKVPADSLVSLETTGVSGELFAQIHSGDASGSVLPSGGVLNTRASQTPTPQQWADCLSNLLNYKRCDLHTNAASSITAPDVPANRSNR